MIGVFTVPIGDLMRSLKEERERETNIIREIIKELSERLGPDDNMEGDEYMARSYRASINGDSVDQYQEQHIDGSIVEEDEDALLPRLSSASLASQGGGLRGKKKKG